MISNANMTREEGLEQANYQEGQQHGTARSSVQSALTDRRGSSVHWWKGFLACTDGEGSLVCTLGHRAPAGARLHTLHRECTLLHRATKDANKQRSIIAEAERIFVSLYKAR